MNKTLSELEAECRNRSITIDPEKKYHRKDLVNLLADRSLFGWEPSWGLKRRLEIESPMLCFPFKNLKEEQKEECLTSDLWIAEEKYNGCRMIVTYHPDDGFEFFGRSVSVEDYLPINYTEKILLSHLKPRDLIGTFSHSFILDCEVIVEEGKIDTRIFSRSRGTSIYSDLNACTAILNLETSASHRVQIEQAPLKFKAFDILYMEGPSPWLIDDMLIKRKSALLRICKEISPIVPISFSEVVMRDKEEFFREIISLGGEGIVLKCLDQPYIATTSRSRHTQVKLKRSMSESLLGDIDAFIIGSVPSTEGKAWEEYIGGLKFGIWLNEGGRIDLHHIATVTGIPLHWRTAFTHKTPSGPELSHEYLHKVMVINGQSVTAKNLRFAHAVIDWKSAPFRPDKTHTECTMEKSFLLSQVM